MSNLSIILERDNGVYVALIEVGSEIVEVSRRFGSWGTLPNDRGVWREVLPNVAAILQGHVKQLERDAII
jgi:hypothetical protein